jgi:hypothetical protein
MRLIGRDHPVLNRWTFLCGLTLAAPLTLMPSKDVPDGRAR